MRFGATGVEDNSDDGVYAVTGNSAGTDSIVNDAQQNIVTTGEPFPVGIPSLGDRLITNLPAAGNASTIAFAILGSNYLLDLELSALQAEGRGQIVSNPRVITSDQTTARIEQGDTESRGFHWNSFAVGAAASAGLVLLAAVFMCPG